MWQPIETRPEEGEFLAYDPVSRKQDVCYATKKGLVEWVQQRNIIGYDYTPGRYETVGFRLSCSAVQQDGEFGPDEDEFRGERATHWQPLPEPPASAIMRP